MDQKPYRFGLLIIGLLVTAVLGYRAVEDETSLGRASREGAAYDRAAGQALEALLDLRASLHAYVAPGQGVPFWSRRSEESLDTLREQVVALDAAARRIAARCQRPSTLLSTGCAERRAREYARRGETLLAADVVFTECAICCRRRSRKYWRRANTLSAATDVRISALRREQAMLAGAIAAGDHRLAARDADQAGGHQRSP